MAILRPASLKSRLQTAAAPFAAQLTAEFTPTPQPGAGLADAAAGALPQEPWVTLPPNPTDVPDEMPAPVDLLREVAAKLEQGEFAAIKAVLSNQMYPLTDRAAAIAHLHDRHVQPAPGLKEWVLDGDLEQINLRPARPATPQQLLAKQHRILLFIHGTFVSAELKLPEFSLPLRAALRDTYAQVLCFDHYTLSVSPRLNARDLYEQLRDYLLDYAHPEAVRIDILCHSRGGLVARELVEKMPQHAPALPIDQVHFVASPNGGTHFASPQRVMKALRQEERFAKLALFALHSEAFAEMLDALTLEETEQVLGYIPGLKAMDPHTTYIRDYLNDGHPAEPLPRYSASCAEYQPHGTPTDDPSTLRLLLEAALAAVGDKMPLVASVMDIVFEDAPNDLVVDTESVTQLHGARSHEFLPPERVWLYIREKRLHAIRLQRPDFLHGVVPTFLDKGTVWHSSFFAEPDFLTQLQHGLLAAR